MEFLGDIFLVQELFFSGGLSIWQATWDPVDWLLPQAARLLVTLQPVSQKVVLEQNIHSCEQLLQIKLLSFLLPRVSRITLLHIPPWNAVYFSRQTVH